MNNIDFILIHIGKCGGNTLNTTLKNLKYKFKKKHIQPINFNPNRKYIIVIRNPISRFISAFNWRMYNVCDTRTQEDRFKGEASLLKKFKTVNALAESLYDSDGTLRINLSEKHFYIHHIYEDINFYIGNFLNICNPENIYGVILTETITNDLKRLFNVDTIPHMLKNKQYDKKLSELGYSNLKKYLHKDYSCIDKMYSMKLITKEQYDILSI